MGLTERLEITADVEGNEDLLPGRIQGALADQLERRSGLTSVAVVSTNYVATVKVGKVLKTEKTGAGADLPSAIQAASGGDSYNRKDIHVAVTQEVEIPYFTVAVAARALSSDAVLQDIERQVRDLSRRFGARVATDPENVRYSVTHTKADYKEAGGLPSTLSRDKTIRRGTSRTSLDDAVKAAGPKPEKAKSTVFEATQNIKVYGTAEKAETAAKQSVVPTGRELAATGTSHRSRDYHSPGSPAGRMPVYAMPQTNLF